MDWKGLIQLFTTPTLFYFNRVHRRKRREGARIPKFVKTYLAVQYTLDKTCWIDKLVKNSIKAGKTQWAARFHNCFWAHFLFSFFQSQLRPTMLCIEVITVMEFHAWMKVPTLSTHNLLFKTNCLWILTIREILSLRTL